MPKFFPRVNIGQMHFDKGNGDPQQRITQRDAGMSEGPGVDHDEIHFKQLCLMHSVHKLVLRIALDAGYQRTTGVCGIDQPCLYVCQALIAVNLRLTRA
jgi:hypothetical protein